MNIQNISDEESSNKSSTEHGSNTKTIENKTYIANEKNEVDPKVINKILPEQNHETCIKQNQMSHLKIVSKIGNKRITKASTK